MIIGSSHYFAALLCFLFIGCSSNKEINGIYINHKRNFHGHLFMIKENEGKSYSWTNCFYTGCEKFTIVRMNDALLINYDDSLYENDTLILKKNKLVMSNTPLRFRKFKKISIKKAKRIVPGNVFKKLSKSIPNHCEVGSD